MRKVDHQLLHVTLIGNDIQTGLIADEIVTAFDIRHDAGRWVIDRHFHWSSVETLPDHFQGTAIVLRADQV